MIKYTIVDKKKQLIKINDFEKLLQHVSSLENRIKELEEAAKRAKVKEGFIFFTEGVYKSCGFKSVISYDIKLNDDNIFYICMNDGDVICIKDRSKRELCELYCEFVVAFQKWVDSQ